MDYVRALGEHRPQQVGRVPAEELQLAWADEYIGTIDAVSLDVFPMGRNYKDGHGNSSTPQLTDVMGDASVDSSDFRRKVVGDEDY